MDKNKYTWEKLFKYIWDNQKENYEHKYKKIK